METVTLPSGAVLKITLSPFDVAKRLFQKVILFQLAMKDVQLADGKDAVADADDQVKTRKLMVAALSSSEVEAAILECFPRCLLNTGGADGPLTPKSFEKPEMWGDYLVACAEVGTANFLPFVKSLSSGYLTGTPSKDATQK
jgi:hypothetical protein